MINEKLVKHLRRKRIIGISTLICGICAGIIGAIAFAGRTPGSFVINLKQKGVRMALSRERTFDDPTTYLKISDTPQFDLGDHSDIVTYNDRLDDEVTNDLNLGAVVDPDTNQISRIKFFKYTFYIKNIGDIATQFHISVNIVDNVKPSNVTYGYDELLRVRIYSNDVKKGTHDYQTYAKRATPNSEINDPEADGREPICDVPGGKDFVGYAEKFVNDSCIYTETVSGFNAGDEHRFTLVTWLEGSDRECTGNAPHGGSLKLGIHIDGERQKTVTE